MNNQKKDPTFMPMTFDTLSAAFPEKAYPKASSDHPLPEDTFTKPWKATIAAFKASNHGLSDTQKWAKAYNLTSYQNWAYNKASFLPGVFAFVSFIAILVAIIIIKPQGI